MSFLDEIIGRTIIKIEGMEKNSEKVIITLDNGDKWKMYHYQECCEQVWLEDVNGNINNLLNMPILKFDEKTNDRATDWGSETFTFYTISTAKGYVDLRWYGESNGYYSESVDFEKIE